MSIHPKATRRQRKTGTGRSVEEGIEEEEGETQKQEGGTGQWEGEQWGRAG